jgi:hypothetical protein
VLHVETLTIEHMDAEPDTPIYYLRRKKAHGELQIMTHKYSLGEIDRMRAALQRKHAQPVYMDYDSAHRVFIRNTDIIISPRLSLKKNSAPA